MAPKKCSSLLDLSQGLENEVECGVRPVTAELEAARNNFFQRGKTPTHVIKPIYIQHKSSKNEKSNKSKRCQNINRQDPILWKLEYQKPPKPKKCHHYENLIIDRQILTRSEHIKVLSKPRKSTINANPKFVPRSIPPMTNWMNKLAQPRKRVIIQTWEKYAPVLTGRQVDKFHDIVLSNQAMNNKRAEEYLKQCRKEERLRRNYQRQKVKKLRKEIERMRLEEIKEIILRVFNEVYEYLCGQQEYHFEPEMAEISVKIYKMICKYLKCNMVGELKKKEKVKLCAIKALANRITKWAQAFLEAAKYEREHKDVDSLKSVSVTSEFRGYPIDDFILADEESLLGQEDFLYEADVYQKELNLEDDEYLLCGEEDVFFFDDENDKQDQQPRQQLKLQEPNSDTIMLVNTLVESLLKLTVPSVTDGIKE